MPDRLRARAPIVAVVLAYLAIGACYTAAVPSWEAPDEPWHLAYAEALAAGRLPEATETYEAHQPPLYYAVLAAVLRAAGIATVPRAPDNPWYPFASAALWHAPGDRAEGQVRVLRTVMGGLGALAVVLTWAAARVAAAGSRRRPALAAALVALTPQAAFITHVLNNDGLALATGALLTYGLLVWLARPARAGVSALVLLAGGALAATSKVNTLALLGAVPVTVVLACRLRSGAATRVPTARRRLLAPLGAVVAGVSGGLAVLAWAVPDVARRALVDALGRGLVVRPDLVRPAVLATHVCQLASSGWARFGWLNVDLPGWMYVVPAAAAVAALGGIACTWRQGRPSERATTCVLATLILASVAAAMKNLVSDPQPQGRLVFPALAALAVLGASGLGAIAPARWRGGLGVVAAAGLLAVNLFVTQVLLPQAYAGARGPYPNDVAVRIVPPRWVVAAELDGRGASGTGVASARQTFRPYADGLRRVDVALAAVRGSGVLTMTLRSERGGVVARRVTDIASNELEANRWLSLAFDPYAGSARRIFTIELAFAPRTSASRVSLWGSPDDVYPDGALTVDGRAGADLMLVALTGDSDPTDR
jgi:hypothetical protein